MKRCLTCRHFTFGTSPAFPEVNGVCRRYAPRGPVIGDGRWQAFPPMGALDGCGEHEELREGSPATQQRWRDAEAYVASKQPRGARKRWPAIEERNPRG